MSSQGFWLLHTDYWHGFNSTTVDFCKISGIINCKSNKYSDQAVTHGNSDSKNKIWSEIYYHQLQHKRCSAHNGDISRNDPSDYLYFGHFPPADQKAKCRENIRVTKKISVVTVIPFASWLNITLKLIVTVFLLLILVF